MDLALQQGFTVYAGCLTEAGMASLEAEAAAAAAKGGNGNVNGSSNGHKIGASYVCVYEFIG